MKRKHIKSSITQYLDIDLYACFHLDNNVISKCLHFHVMETYSWTFFAGLQGTQYVTCDYDLCSF